MSQFKLIYFEGCPNAKHARAALLAAGINDFEVILQNKLDMNDKYKGYSSPSIMGDNNDLVFGSKVEAEACSSQVFNFDQIRDNLIQRNQSSVPPSSKGILATIGSFSSSALVGFCPICIPAIGAFLSSIGLGFLVQEKALMTILIVFLLLSIFGLSWSYLKEHRNPGPLVLGVIMAVVMFTGRYVFFNTLLMYESIAGLIGAAIWNLRLRKKENCPACV